MRSRIPLPVIVLLGLFLLAPTAALGFYADDYVHQLVLRGGDELAPMEPWALYDFGTYADWSHAEETVWSTPWWGSPDWKVRFMRPVTSLYLMGLHALFGEWSLGYHLVGLGLHALLIVLVFGLYRTLGLSERAAKLGTLFFAACDSATLPVGWAANHNSLLAAVFSVAALRLLLPRGASTVQLVIGLLLAVAAAASKEAGAVTLALAAFVLLRKREGPARALGGLAVLLGLIYAVLLVGGGYGTRSLFYATPWHEPGRFLGNLLFLLAAGPTSLLGPFPLDAVGLFPVLRWPLVAVGVLIGFPIWGWILRGVRHARGVGLLLLWTLAFLVVQAASLPSDRLLYLPSIGALGLIGIFLDGSPRPLGRGRVALFLTVTVASGLSLLIQGAGLAQGAAFLRESLPHTDVGDPELGHREIYLLQTESQFQAFTLHSMWGFHEEDRDLTFWNLQSGNRPVRWTRIDENTFELETLGAPFLTGPFEKVYLSRPPDFEVGDTWSTSAFDVEALAVEDGWPTALRFRMKNSLDRETVRFLRAVEGKLVRILPPAVGETLELETPARAGPYMP